MENHKSMLFRSENGNVATVLGSENMSNETKMMLSKLIDVATNHVEKRIDCHACQGGGCPVCNGYGYYYAD